MKKNNLLRNSGVQSLLASLMCIAAAMKLKDAYSLEGKL